jgi:selenocysteine lyase/cysteine desulfurase
MLSQAGQLDAAYFEDLRAREFSRLDRRGITYLDYAASGLYGASQAAAYADLLADGVFGNPHSEHRPSRDSMVAIDATRTALLQAIGLSAGEYAVCFTANTSAAIKLVAEAWPFAPRRGLVLSQDNHNSVNGIREYARTAGATVSVLPLDADLRLDDAEARLTALPEGEGGLLAFPAQSNFSGVQHPLRLIAAAKAKGYDVLVDAAGLSPGGCAALSEWPADFIALSFYKFFGLPTGVGALVARHDALVRLRRPWFAGGTVDFVSIELDRHQLQRGAEGFHDGTPNFLGIAAVPHGFALLRALDPHRIGGRMHVLTGDLLGRLQGLRHADGAPMVQLYGPDQPDARGATIAFNLLSPDGVALPYAEVEREAADHGVAIRGGCFCNPGASERAFGFQGPETARCLAAVSKDFSIARFAQCMGPERPVGALRISLGYPTIAADLDRAVELIESCASRGLPGLRVAKIQASAGMTGLG